MSRDVLGFAKENGLEVKRLTPYWIRLDGPEVTFTWRGKVKARIHWWFLNIKWSLSAVKRYVKNIPKLWKLHLKCKKWNKYLLKQAEITKSLGPATPPTPEQVEAFKKEWDLGWDSHMIQRVEPRRTYFEASLN